MIGRIDLPVKLPEYKIVDNFTGLVNVVANVYKNGEIWLQNNSIQLTFRNYVDTNQIEINLSNFNFWGIPFVQEKNICTMRIKNCVLNVIEQMIQNNFYIYFSYIDDFYIKGKYNFNIRHTAGNGIISGFDKLNQTLTIVSLNEDLIFDQFTIPIQNFEEAINSKYTSNNSRLHFLKINEYDSLKLEIKNIIKNLFEYINPVYSNDNIYGIFVYDELLKYMVNSASLNFCTEPCERLLQHKYFLYHIMYNIEINLHDDDNFSQSFCKIIQKTSELCHLVKNNRKTNDMLLNEFQILIEYIKTQEVEVLSNFIEFLKIEADKYVKA